MESAEGGTTPELRAPASRGGVLEARHGTNSRVTTQEWYSTMVAVSDPEKSHALLPNPGRLRSRTR